MRSIQQPKNKVARTKLRPALLLTSALAIALSSAAFADTVIDGGVTDTIPGTFATPFVIPDNLIVGETGNGTLNISTTGSVTDNSGIIGDQAGSTGMVSLNGNSTWANQTLYIGNNGQGTLNIYNGGFVSASTGLAIGNMAGSTGALNVNDAASLVSVTNALVVGESGTGFLFVLNGAVVNSGSGVIGDLAGGTGTATISDAGSRWNSATAMIIGNGGSGTLKILNGGYVSDNFAALGISSSGSATVDGAGSTWDNLGQIAVGVLADSDITVSNGGTLNSTVGYLNYVGGGSGSATISGAGSSWNVLDDIHAGYASSGAAHILVESGGLLSTHTLGAGENDEIGDAAGSTADVTVTGAGSEWSDDVLDMGNDGNGALNVLNGGLVSTSSAVLVGKDSGSTGLIVVDGNNSSLTAPSVAIGYDGDGRIVLSNGGTLSVNGGIGTLEMSPDGGGAELDIGAQDGDPAQAPGTLLAANVFLEATNNDSIVFNHTSNNYVFAPTITGDGYIRSFGGTTILTGDSEFHTGGVYITNSTLLVDNLLGVSTVNHFAVWNGTVGGTGSILGLLDFQNNGTLLGVGGQTLTIGALNLVSGTNTNVSLGAPSNTALFSVTNDLTLDGTLNIGGTLGFGAGVYRLFDYGGTLTDNGLDIGTTPLGSTAADYTVQTSVAGQVNLISAYAGAPVGPFEFWDGDSPVNANNNQVDGGGGTWSTTSMTFTDANGTVNHSEVPQPGFPIFEGLPGVVAIDDTGGDVTINGMQVATRGYEFVGDAITLNDPNTIFRIGTGTPGTNVIAYISAPLVGSGGLDKTDYGELILNANNTYTGATTVENGILKFNGSNPFSVFTIGNGAIFNGNSTVGGLIMQTGSTVAPGNSIGVVNVAGNYSAATGTTYDAEIDGLGAADLIHATGTATIDHGAVLDVIRTGATQPIAGTRYTVVTADGGLTGNYALVGDTAVSPFLSIEENTDPTHVYLDVVQTTSLASIGATPNEIATGGGVDSLGGGESVFDAVTALPSFAAANAALDLLSGEIHASAQNAMVEDSRFLRDAVNARLQSADDANGFAFWANAFGSWGHWDTDGNAATMRRDIGGIFAGVDHAMGDWRFGAVTGYSRSNLNVVDRTSRGDSSNYHLGFYAGRSWGDLSLRSGVAYTWHDLDTRRAINFAGFSDATAASYRAGTTQAFAELGDRFALGSGALEPFANLAYVNLSTRGFAETGGAAALTARGSNEDTTFTTLGLRASTALGGDFSAHATAGWRHAFGDVVPTSTFTMDGSAPFTIAGVPLARDSAVVGAGIEETLAPGVTVGLGYDGQFGSGVSDQSLHGNLTIKF